MRTPTPRELGRLCRAIDGSSGHHRVKPSRCSPTRSPLLPGASPVPLCRTPHRAHASHRFALLTPPGATEAVCGKLSAGAGQRYHEYSHSPTFPCAQELSPESHPIAMSLSRVHRRGTQSLVSFFPPGIDSIQWGKRILILYPHLLSSSQHLRAIDVACPQAVSTTEHSSLVRSSTLLIIFLLPPDRAACNPTRAPPPVQELC
jgi:hypothetical protein